MFLKPDEFFSMFYIIVQMSESQFSNLNAFALNSLCQTSFLKASETRTKHKNQILIPKTKNILNTNILSTKSSRKTRSSAFFIVTVILFILRNTIF